MKSILALPASLLAIGASFMGAWQTRSAQFDVNSPSPQKEILSEPVHLQVSLQPGLDTDEEIRLVCRTDTYQGESSSQKQDSTLRMAISGAIQRMNRDRFLVRYNLEVQIHDRSGGTGFSAAGSGLFLDGKPTKIVTISRWSVTMTATTIKGNVTPTK